MGLPMGWTRHDIEIEPSKIHPRGPVFNQTLCVDGQRRRTGSGRIQPMGSLHRSYHVRTRRDQGILSGTRRDPSIHPSNEHQPPTERRGDLHTRRLLQTHVPHPRGNEAQHRHTHPPRPSRSSTRTHTRSSRKKRKRNKQTRIAPDTKTRRSKTPAKTVGSEPRRSRQTQQKKTSVELAPKDPPNTQPKDNDEETRERRRR